MTIDPTTQSVPAHPIPNLYAVTSIYPISQLQWKPLAPTDTTVATKTPVDCSWTAPTFSVPGHPTPSILSHDTQSASSSECPLLDQRLHWPPEPQKQASSLATLTQFPLSTFQGNP